MERVAMVSRLPSTVSLHIRTQLHIYFTLSFTHDDLSWNDRPVN